MSAPTTVAERGLDALYAEVPAIACKGLCQNSCGPVMMSRVEWERIVKRVGHAPHGRADLNCPLLTAVGRCKVYGARPMVCRLWGVVESMPCHHGCEPERTLTDQEGYDLLARARELGA